MLSLKDVRGRTLAPSKSVSVGRLDWMNVTGLLHSCPAICGQRDEEVEEDTWEGKQEGEHRDTSKKGSAWSSWS